MQPLNIPLIETPNNQSIECVAARMDGCERHCLQFIPWPVFPYKPQVCFSIGYDNSAIFLKYFVIEQSIRAVVRDINGPVWEDSCVEFFISFDGKGYYNLEFNCIGTALVGYGKNKDDRFLLPEEIVKAITFKTGMRQQEDLISWELALRIPRATFAFHEMASLEGQMAKGNFFKCGDKLAVPHFISWNHIVAPEPDFHLPQFFGDLSFESRKVLQ